MRSFVVALLLAGSLRTQDVDKPWTVLPSITGKLCPNICIWKPVGNQSTSVETTDCCGECSCDDSCGLEGNCCFKKLGPTRGEMPDGKSCIVTQKTRHFKTAFKMIDRNPRGGCVNSAVNKIKKNSQCGKMTAAPWGTLYPVTSRLTGKIYKNKHCAKCHGETGFQSWKVLQKCNMVTDLVVPLYDNIISSTQVNPYCDYFFEKTGLELNIASQQCFKGPLISSCDNQNFDVMDLSSISRSAMVRACTSGLYSPVYWQNKGLWFANIFCKMCNSVKHNCMEQSERRPTTFLTLLRTDLEPFFTSKSPKQACRMTTEKRIRENCRPVLCPIGQMHVDGKCKCIVDSWDNALICATLHLVLLGESPVFKGIHALTSLVNTNTVIWDDKWNISIIWVKHHSNISDITVDELLVEVSYIYKMASAEGLLLSLQNSLKQLVSMVLGNSTLRFKPSLSRFRARMGVYAFPNITYTKIFWRVFDVVTSSRLDISQMFYCERIELAEYEVTKILDYWLYNNITGKFLNVYDHMKKKEADGTIRYQVCLSDSGFLVRSAGFQMHFSVIYHAIVIIVTM